MSRVFSALTGTNLARAGAAEGHAGEPFVGGAEGLPFVEIGGPAGPVFSKPAEAKKPEPRPFPRIAPAPADPTVPLLSVRFHDAVQRTSVRPPAGPDAGLVALHFPDHPVSAEYRTLRDEVARQLPEGTSRALWFTAAATGSGTTTVVLNLALTLARDGQRVLVVDANLQHPGVAAKLALRPTPGLAEVLGQNLPLPWAVQPTPAPTLQALAAGTADDSTPAAVGRDLPKLLAQLRQWFDWVLIDAGVWGVTAELDAACPTAEAVYLVTREPDAERPEFAGLKTWVKQLGGSLRGYVTTRA
ncbi:MAG: CpsD/CapB family tyrosine-protein kinase [Gemmataceae bacterium]|nr:CpsD/CapB family tyrosine-protein kinase [Gemmataceae bacterium]